MQDRSRKGFCVVGLAYRVVRMGSLRERGRPWGFVRGVRSHVQSHRAQEELCRRFGARCLARVRMCDDLRSVWFGITPSPTKSHAQDTHANMLHTERGTCASHHCSARAHSRPSPRRRTPQ